MMIEYVITIKTDLSDADSVVRNATEEIACRIGWGNENTTSIEAVRRDVGLPDLYLAGYEMEPGCPQDLIVCKPDL